MASGPELRAARLRANVTLDELARQAGWSHRAVPAQVEARVTVTPRTSARYRAALAAVLQGRLGDVTQ